MRYFIHEATRMVRTMDDWDAPPPPQWKEVDGAAYDAFRKETKTFSAKTLKNLRSKNA